MNWDYKNTAYQDRVRQYDQQQGGGKENPKTGDDLPDGQYRQNGYTYLTGKTHPQGQPMTAMYEQAYNDAYAKWQSGMDYDLLLKEITSLVTGKRITDYEGNMILRDLDRWEKTKSDKKASGSGGGGGSQWTQMTK